MEKYSTIQSYLGFIMWAYKMNVGSIRKYLKQQHFKYKDDPFSLSFSNAGLQFMDMAKDVIDTFKPYKNKAQRERDLYQFFNGLKKVVFGVPFLFLGGLGILELPVSWIFSPLICIGFCCYNALNHLVGSREAKPFMSTIKDEYSNLLFFSNYIVNSLVSSVADITRGVTQIITSPFALLRVLWRDALSKDVDTQKFQDRKSIKKLVVDADEILANSKDINAMRIVIDELYRKSYDNICYKEQESYPNKKIMVSYCNNDFGIGIHYNNANGFFKDDRNRKLNDGEQTRIKKHLESFRVS